VSTVLKGKIDWLHCSLSGWTLGFMSSEMLSTAGLLSKSPIVYIVSLPHETLVYPPKIYFPTLIIVTVGPLLWHREWNVLAAQPSTDARQQTLQLDWTFVITGESQLFNEVKWFLLFPTIMESCKPTKIFHFHWQKNYGRAKLFKIWHQLTDCYSGNCNI